MNDSDACVEMQPKMTISELDDYIWTLRYSLEHVTSKISALRDEEQTIMGLIEEAEKEVADEHSK